MPFSIERNDLARMNVDAVVVAANEELQITGGVGGDVAAAAGLDRVQSACDEIGFCPTGSAVATPGFHLPASTIVHAVGPIWQGGHQGEDEVLRKTYASALRCCADAGARSIALPLLSAGSYGFPSEVSFRIAMEEIRAFLESNDVDVRLVLFNRAAVKAAMASFGDIAEYIDDHYVDERATAQFNRYEADRWVGQAGGPGGDYGSRFPQDERSLSTGSFPSVPPGASAPMQIPRPRDEKKPQGPLSRISEFIEEVRTRKRETADMDIAPDVESASYSVPCAQEDVAAAPLIMHETVAQVPASGLGEWLDALDEPFSTTLLSLIDARGLSDVQVYKRANMSRQLFSRIRSDAGYRPTKKTALALAIALELDIDETNDLLKRAGLALSNSSKGDVIVEYFIVHGMYDIFAINEALYAFDQPLL